MSTVGSSGGSSKPPVSKPASKPVSKPATTSKPATSTSSSASKPATSTSSASSASTSSTAKSTTSTGSSTSSTSKTGDSSTSKSSITDTSKNDSTSSKSDSDNDSSSSTKTKDGFEKSHEAKSEKEDGKDGKKSKTEELISSIRESFRTDSKEVNKEIDQVEEKLDVGNISAAEGAQRVEQLQSRLTDMSPEKKEKFEGKVEALKKDLVSQVQPKADAADPSALRKIEEKGEAKPANERAKDEPPNKATQEQNPEQSIAQAKEHQESPKERFEQANKKAEDRYNQLQETGDKEALTQVDRAYEAALAKRDETMQALTSQLKDIYPADQARQMAEGALGGKAQFYSNVNGLAQVGGQEFTDRLQQTNPLAAEMTRSQGLAQNGAGSGKSQVQALKGTLERDAFGRTSIKQKSDPTGFDQKKAESLKNLERSITSAGDSQRNKLTGKVQEAKNQTDSKSTSPYQASVNFGSLTRGIADAYGPLRDESLEQARSSKPGDKVYDPRSKVVRELGSPADAGPADGSPADGKLEKAQQADNKLAEANKVEKTDAEKAKLEDKKSAEQASAENLKTEKPAHGSPADGKLDKAQEADKKLAEANKADKSKEASPADGKLEKAQQADDKLAEANKVEKTDAEKAKLDDKKSAEQAAAENLKTEKPAHGSPADGKPETAQEADGKVDEATKAGPADGKLEAAKQTDKKLAEANKADKSKEASSPADGKPEIAKEAGDKVDEAKKAGPADGKPENAQEADQKLAEANKTDTPTQPGDKVAEDKKTADQAGAEAANPETKPADPTQTPEQADKAAKTDEEPSTTSSMLGAVASALANPLGTAVAFVADPSGTVSSFWGGNRPPMSEAQKTEFRGKLENSEANLRARAEGLKKGGDPATLSKVNAAYEAAQKDRDKTVSALQKEYGKFYSPEEAKTRAENALKSKEDFYASYVSLQENARGRSKADLEKLNAPGAELAIQRLKESQPPATAALTGQQRADFQSGAMRDTFKDLASTEEGRTTLRQRLTEQFAKNNVDPKKIDELVQQAQQGKFPLPDQIQVVPANDPRLGEHGNTFDPKTKQFLVSENVAADPARLQRALFAGSLQNVTDKLGVEPEKQDFWGWMGFSKKESTDNRVFADIHADVTRRTNDVAAAAFKGFENLKQAPQKLDQARKALGDELRRTLRLSGRTISDKDLKDQTTAATQDYKSYQTMFGQLYTNGDEKSRARMRELDPKMASALDRQGRIEDRQQLSSINETAYSNKFEHYRDRNDPRNNLDALHHIDQGFELAKKGDGRATTAALAKAYEEQGLSRFDARQKAESALESDKNLYTQYSSLYKAADEDGKKKLRELNPHLADLAEKEASGKLRTNDQWRADIKKDEGAGVLGTGIGATDKSTIERIEGKLTAANTNTQNRSFRDMSQAKIKERATKDEAAFRETLNKAFPKAGEQSIDRLVELAKAGEFPMAENVRFVDASDPRLNKQNAAFDSDNSTVYIDKALMKTPDKAISAYLEENGHHLDSKLGGRDSRGDEGEIFKDGVLGGRKGLEKDRKKYRENDGSYIIMPDGTLRFIENQNREHGGHTGGHDAGPGHHRIADGPRRLDPVSFRHEGPPNLGRHSGDFKLDRVDPGRNFDRDPGRNFDRDPGRNFDRDPGRNFDRDPGRNFDRDSGRNFDRDPGRNFDKPPDSGRTERNFERPSRDIGRTEQPQRNFEAPQPRPDLTPPAPPEKKVDQDAVRKDMELKNPDELKKLEEAAGKLKDIPQALGELEKLQAAFKDLGGLSRSLDDLKSLSRSMSNLKDLNGNLESLQKLGALQNLVKELPEKLANLEKLPAALESLGDFKKTFGDLNEIPKMLDQMKELPKQMAELERLPKVLAAFNRGPDSLHGLEKLPSFLQSAIGLAPEKAAPSKTGTTQPGVPGKPEVAGGVAKGAVPRPVTAANSGAGAERPSTSPYAGRFGADSAHLGPNIGQDASRHNQARKGAILPPGQSPTGVAQTKGTLSGAKGLPRSGDKNLPPTASKNLPPSLGRNLPESTGKTLPQTGRLFGNAERTGPADRTPPAAGGGGAEQSKAAPPTPQKGQVFGEKPGRGQAPSAPSNFPSVDPASKFARALSQAGLSKAPAGHTVALEPGRAAQLRELPQRLEAAGKNTETANSLQRLQGSLGKATGGLEKLPSALKAAETMPRSISDLNRLNTTLGKKDAVNHGLTGLRTLADMAKNNAQQLDGLHDLAGILTAAKDRPDTLRGMARMPGLVGSMTGVQGSSGEAMANLLKTVQAKPAALEGLKTFNSLMASFRDNPQLARSIDQLSKMMQTGQLDQLAESSKKITQALANPQSVFGLDKLESLARQYKNNPNPLNGLERFGQVLNGKGSQGAQGLNRLSHLMELAHSKPESLRGMVDRALERAVTTNTPIQTKNTLNKPEGTAGPLLPGTTPGKAAAGKSGKPGFGAHNIEGLGNIRAKLDSLGLTGEPAGLKNLAPQASGQAAAQPPLDKSKDPARLREYRQAFNMLEELGTQKHGTDEHTKKLAEMSGVFHGAQAVADAFEAKVVAKPENLHSTLENALKTRESSRSFAKTLANMAEHTPERLAGILLLAKDQPEGRKTLTDLFSHLSQDRESAASLGKMLGAGSRTELSATGMKEILGGMFSAENDAEGVMTQQATRALADTSRSQAGARGLAETFHNLTTTDGGSREIGSLLRRMNSSPEGSRASSEMLLNLAQDRQGAKELSRVLSRASKSQAGGRDLLVSFQTMAKTEAGKNDLGRLMMRLTDSDGGAKMLANLTRDKDNAQRFGKLLSSLHDSPQAGANVRTAIEKALQQPQARAEMEAFRGRLHLNTELKQALEGLATPAQNQPFQLSQSAKGADAMARLTAFENLARAATGQESMDTKISTVKAAEASSSGNTASGGNSGHGSESAPFPNQSQPYPDLATVSDVWKQHHLARPEGKELLAQQASGSAHERAETAQQTQAERLAAFRPGDVYSDMTLLRARICGDCGFRTNSIGQCGRCGFSLLEQAEQT